MMTDAAVETAYLAWLAEQKLPADEVYSVIREYGTGENVFRAVTEGNPRLTEILRSGCRRFASPACRGPAESSRYPRQPPPAL